MVITSSLQQHHYNLYLKLYSTNSCRQTCCEMKTDYTDLEMYNIKEKGDEYGTK
jgi:hypothetical protein